MVTIDRMGFGWIVIDGKKRWHDVVIYPDGKVKRRKGGFLMFGSHKIKREEIEELYKSGAEVLVIGTGTDGVAELTDDARKFIDKMKISLVELYSREAIREFKKLLKENKRVGAIIHVTC